MSVARFATRLTWRLVPPADSVELPGWEGALPRLTTDGLAASKRRADAESLVSTLAAELSEPLAKSLAETWHLGATGSGPGAQTGDRPGVVRFVVRTPEGEEHDVLSAGPTVRFGAGASCHVVCPSAEVAEEHLEFQIGKGGVEKSGVDVGATPVRMVNLDSASGTRLNGRPIPAHDPHAVRSRDEVTFGGYSVTLAEAPPATKGDASSAPARVSEVAAAVEVAEVALAERENAFERWGWPGARWMPLLIAGRRCFVGLPSSWTDFAYRALGHPAPPDAGFDNDVDCELTTFALKTALDGLARRSGITITCGPLLMPGELPIDSGGARASGAAADVGFVGVRLMLRVAGQPLDCVFVSSASLARGRSALEESGRAAWLRDLEFPVAVELGEAALPIDQFDRLVEGDVILPDHWLGAGCGADGQMAGSVRLRTAEWVRSAELTETTAGCVVEVRSHAWACRPKGEIMPSQQLSPGPADELETKPEPIESELQVVVTFELDRLSVPLRDLSSWSEGATVELRRSPTEPIRILLHDGAGARMIGRGQVVLVEGEIGVRIDEWWPASEDEKDTPV